MGVQFALAFQLISGTLVSTPFLLHAAKNTPPTSAFRHHLHFCYHSTLVKPKPITSKRSSAFFEVFNV